MSNARQASDDASHGKPRSPAGPAETGPHVPPVEYVEPGLMLPPQPWVRLWVVWQDGRATTREIALLRRIVPGLADRSIAEVLEAAGDGPKWLLGQFEDHNAVHKMRRRAHALGIVTERELEPGVPITLRSARRGPGDGALPETNNVYGQVVAASLDRLMAAAKAAHPWDRAHIYRSGYSGAETLHLQGDLAELDTEPLEGDKHLLNGAVTGSNEAMVAFLQRLSETLKRDGIQHSLELYDDNDVLLMTIRGDV